MKPARILTIAILLYIVVFATISFWKYDRLLYNGLDLAIYNNVFWNTSIGDWFQSSIHDPSYLGDHFEPIMLALLPFYMLWRDPRMLLLLQTVILALTAIPVYYIAKSKILNLKSKIPLLFALLWLLNPFVHNANLFEFHMLVFAPFFLFWMWYFFLKRNFFLFSLTMLGALLIREDVSFVVFMVGVVALLPRVYPLSLRATERSVAISWIKWDCFGRFHSLAMTIQKEWFWILAPILLSTFWFFGSLKLIGHFAPSGSYKFLFYYSWLGETPIEILKNIVLHPIDVLQHFLSFGNLEMTLGFFIPFLFLPLLRPHLLLLSLGSFLQMLLGAPGGSAIVLQTHYAMLFLPALLLATLDALNRAIVWKKIVLPIPLLLGVATLYGMVTLGPLPSAITAITKQKPRATKTQQAMIAAIPRDASVATTYAALTPLSSRRDLFSLHYVYLGVKQYSETPYTLPVDPEYILIDFDDAVNYQFQFTGIPFYDEQQKIGPERLRALLEQYHAQMQEGSVVLFKRGQQTERPLYTFTRNTDAHEPEFHAEKQRGRLALTWTIRTPHDKQEIIDITTNDQTITVPAAWGLLPELFKQKNVTITMFVTLDSLMVPGGPVTIRRFHRDGFLVLDNLRSVGRRFRTSEEIGTPITL